MLKVEVLNTISFNLYSGALLLEARYWGLVMFDGWSNHLLQRKNRVSPKPAPVA